MTSQVLGGAILAIGIAYVKVSPFLPEVKTHTHTHTHTPWRCCGGGVCLPPSMLAVPDNDDGGLLRIDGRNSPDPGQRV